MQRINRKDFRAPACVLDLELQTTNDSYEDKVIVEQYNTAWCLSRIGGIPWDISFWDVADDAIISIRMLCDQLRAERFTNESIIKESPAQRDCSSEPNRCNLYP